MEVLLRRSGGVWWVEHSRVDLSNISHRILTQSEARVSASAGLLPEYVRLGGQGRFLVPRPWIMGLRNS
jgi:hypothetical protein